MSRISFSLNDHIGPPNSLMRTHHIVYIWTLILVRSHHNVYVFDCPFLTTGLAIYHSNTGYAITTRGCYTTHFHVPQLPYLCYINNYQSWNSYLPWFNYGYQECVFDFKSPQLCSLLNVEQIIRYEYIVPSLFNMCLSYSLCSVIVTWSHTWIKYRCPIKKSNRFTPHIPQGEFWLSIEGPQTVFNK